MKYLKMLGLAAVAAAALTTFFGAGTASATVLCKTTVTSNCGTGWHYTGALSYSLESGTTATLTSPWVNIHCTTANIGGTPSTTGSATTTVEGPVSVMEFKGCTCGSRTAHVNVINKGEMEVHHIAGTDDGTLTAKNQTVTIQCTGLSTCNFQIGPDGSHLGRATSHNTTIDATGTLEHHPGHSGSFICGSTAVWHALLKQTVPANEDVFVSAS